MKIEELRRGNLVLINGEIKRVLGFFNEMAINSNATVDFIQADNLLDYLHCYLDPIPLTEEILLKCGFEYKDFGSEYPFYIYEKEGIEMWHFNGKHWICDMLDQKSINMEFKYLHQIQNLYFSLTGKEINTSEFI